MVKPTVVHQGKVIVEIHSGEFWVMFPDGTVQVVLTKAVAEQKAKAWFKKHLSKGLVIGVGEIEWR